MRIDPSRFARPLSLVYGLWCRSLRLEGIGQEWIDEAGAKGRRLVYATWHNELFPLAWYAFQQGLNVAAMVSQSRDGELVSRIIERLDILTVRGSSSRGGIRALVAAKRMIERQGRGVGIAVDGPRGPRHVVKAGAIHLASLTGAYIVPLRARMAKAYVFRKAWDKFQLPWPFSRCHVLFGEPYAIPSDLDEAGLAKERSRLEQRLKALDFETRQS